MLNAKSNEEGKERRTEDPTAARVIVITYGDIQGYGRMLNSWLPREEWSLSVVVFKNTLCRGI